MDHHNLAKRVAVFSPAKRALLERRLREKGFSNPTIPRRKGPDAVPLSFAQQRLWFLDQLAPGGIEYNMPSTLRLTGPLDVTALERSLNEIVRRHEILRTSFTKFEGEPVQLIAPSLIVPLPLLDLSILPENEREVEVRRVVRDEGRKPFDLALGPLIKATLIRLAAEDHLLLLLQHHIVSDGWSLGILLRELGVIYDAFSHGKSSPLEELPIQYADFALWQRTWLQEDVLDKQLSYWKQVLGELPQFYFPMDHPRPAVQSFHGDRLSVVVPVDVVAGLNAWSRRENATLYMVLLAAFNALLHRYTGQNEVVLGSPIANRNLPEVEGLIGFFVNSLVMRNSVDGNADFRELLARVREGTLGAYEHQDLPFERLVEVLEPERDLGRNPLFQIIFAVQNAPLEGQKIGGLTLETMSGESETTRFDLEVHIWERGSELTIVFIYNTALFEPATIERLALHYQNVLRAMVADAGRRIADIELLSSEERDQLVIGWNATGREYPRGKRIDELFEAQAVRSAEAVALIDGGERLSYGEVNRRANQVGRYLRERGVRRGSLVGIAMERSVDLIVGILGILKAGGAYVPLDPSYPQERLKYILGDTGAAVILTQQRHMDSLPQSGAEVVCLDRDRQEIGAQSGENLGIEGVAEDLAYVMYTSGSTGVPKGVEVPHRGVVRLLFGVDYVRLDAEQRFLHLAPTSFDASTFEIWGSLLHGGQCVLYPGRVPSPFELGELLHKHEINTLWLTASLFNAVIDGAPEALSGVRQLLIGGEALSVPHVRRALALLPQTQIINGYGPTESTTFTCCYSIPRPLEENLSSIPIGKPIGNTEVYILDSQLHPVPIGVAGELYIGGDGLARGYLNQPELTAEKFIEHPFSEDSQARLYKTGDRVRYLADGNIEFLERLDNQVKIRGYRIELGEIEAVLNEHSGVSQSVVAVREDTPGDKRLVAYVVPKLDKNNSQTGGQDRSLERQYIAEWQRLYDQTYGNLPAPVRRDIQYHRLEQ